MLQAEHNNKLKVVDSENLEKLRNKELQLSMSQWYALTIYLKCHAVFVVTVEEKLSAVSKRLPGAITEIPMSFS